jgi:hypothetical protein
MLVNMLIINRFQTGEFAGNYRILPKANRELLPEITGMNHGKQLDSLIISEIENSQIAGFYRIK